ARAGRRGDQRVAALADGLPAPDLGIGRSSEARREPLADRRVKGIEPGHRDHPNRTGRRTVPRAATAPRRTRVYSRSIGAEWHGTCSLHSSVTDNDAASIAAHLSKEGTVKFAHRASIAAAIFGAAALSLAQDASSTSPTPAAVVPPSSSSEAAPSQ